MCPEPAGRSRRPPDPSDSDGGHESHLATVLLHCILGRAGRQGASILADDLPTDELKHPIPQCFRSIDQAEAVQPFERAVFGGWQLATMLSAGNGVAADIMARTRALPEERSAAAVEYPYSDGRRWPRPRTRGGTGGEAGFVRVAAGGGVLAVQPGRDPAGSLAGERERERLEGSVLQGVGYEPLVRGADGSIRSEVLELEVRVDDRPGMEHPLRFRDPETNEDLPMFRESEEPGPTRSGPGPRRSARWGVRRLRRGRTPNPKLIDARRG